MSVKTDYDQWHANRDIDADAEEIWYRRVKELVVASRDFEDKRVLEIGCGRGGFAIWLARQPFRPRQFIAADFSPAALKRGSDLAASLGISSIDWKEVDITNMPFKDGAFDTVVSCETIEHVASPAKAVSELARVLCDGGRLFLTTPNYFNLMGAWRCYRYLVGRPFTEAGQPVNRLMMMPLTLRSVRRAGIKIERFGSDDLLIPRFGRPPFRLNAMYSASRIGRYFGLQSWLVGRKS